MSGDIASLLRLRDAKANLRQNAARATDTIVCLVGDGNGAVMHGSTMWMYVRPVSADLGLTIAANPSGYQWTEGQLIHCEYFHNGPGANALRVTTVPPRRSQYELYFVVYHDSDYENDGPGARVRAVYLYHRSSSGVTTRIGNSLGERYVTSKQPVAGQFPILIITNSSAGDYVNGQYLTYSYNGIGEPSFIGYATPSSTDPTYDSTRQKYVYDVDTLGGNVYAVGNVDPPLTVSRPTRCLVQLSGGIGVVVRWLLDTALGSPGVNATNLTSTARRGSQELIIYANGSYHAWSPGSDVSINDPSVSNNPLDLPPWYTANNETIKNSYYGVSADYIVKRRLSSAVEIWGTDNQSSWQMLTSLPYADYFGAANLLVTHKEKTYLAVYKYSTQMVQYHELGTSGILSTTEYSLASTGWLASAVAVASNYPRACVSDGTYIYHGGGQISSPGSFYYLVALTLETGQVETIYVSGETTISPAKPIDGFEGGRLNIVGLFVAPSPLVYPA